MSDRPVETGPNCCRAWRGGRPSCKSCPSPMPRKTAVNKTVDQWRALTPSRLPGNPRMAAAGAASNCRPTLAVGRMPAGFQVSSSIKPAASRDTKKPSTTPDRSASTVSIFLAASAQGRNRHPAQRSQRIFCRSADTYRRCLERPPSWYWPGVAAGMPPARNWRPRESLPCKQLVPRSSVVLRPTRCATPAPQPKPGYEWRPHCPTASPEQSRGGRRRRCATRRTASAVSVSEAL